MMWKSACPLSTPALELRGLDVGHGAQALVREVCLAVRPGQVVALIGPNGSGKTTILRTVAGQLRALGGVVELFGRELGGIPIPCSRVTLCTGSSARSPAAGSRPAFGPGTARRYSARSASRKKCPTRSASQPRNR